MAKHTIKSKIGGTLNSRLLELEGEFINLNPDGSATKTVDVIGPLNIAATVQGAPGTEWTLDVSEGSTQLVSEKSTIGAGITD
ncbi:MAG TPA: hypothetical protein VF521_19225, partial [Pyrinomonadaceae bacterium]